jgi:hypothetical protein
MHLHLHLPHLPLPAVLLSVVYAMALAVALADPGQHTPAGLVVLAGLTARWLARYHRSVAPAATVAVPAPDAEPVVAPAVAT